MSISRQFRMCDKLVNVSATGVVFRTIVRILAEMNAKLALLVSCGKEIELIMVKKFLVDFLMLEIVEVGMFGAF